MINKISQNKIIPIILAGGTGTRLWPISRKSFPKQFLELTDDDELTLLQKTYKRIESLNNISEPIIICNEEHRFIVGDQMQKINTNPLSIILEPIGRNTAPAIIISALKALEENKNDDPILLILSSDHQIKNESKFKTAIKESIKPASEGKIVIFGVIPTYPSTAYGYIQSNNKLNYEKSSLSKVENFKEKPNLETAKIFFKDKKYTWNSGMFVFKASTIIEEIKKYFPDILENCVQCLNKSRKDLDFLRIDESAFKKCKDISIDVAVLEKTTISYVLPLDCGWDDIGSWGALWQTSKKDSQGNSIKGKVFSKNTKNSLIRSQDKLIVSLGIKDLIIVDTKDALLVADKDQCQDIKEIVNTLKKKGFSEAKQHKKVYRPWGNYLSIEEEKTWQIKKIQVNPGKSLSLQLHNQRSEHWIVVDGIAEVELNEKVEILRENESKYIPLGSKHRLSNPGDIPLILIEVQSGEYLGEDDIIRFKDNYGRVK